MMRKANVVLLLLLALLVGVDASAGRRKAWSDSDGVFYLKTGDGLETYTVSGSITFKAVADGNTIPSGRDAGVVFAPSGDGEIIEVSVNSIDVSGDNYLLVYDGAIEKIGYNAGTGAEGQTNWLPDGSIKKLQSGDAGYTFTSTSDDGKVSFGFHSGYSVSGQTGWTITVTSKSLKDMEYVSTEALTGLSSVNRGEKGKDIFGVNVKTDGGSNPLTLNSLTIDGSALSGNVNVSNLRVVRGSEQLATAAVGQNIALSDVTLKGGDNKFMVLADIAPDASGAIPSLSVSAVTVDGEARQASPSTGNAVDINNVILMPAEATTFTIDDATEFYDDGGKDGKIGSKFTGQLTFVPATQGNAIKVNFSKLAIFNTSSTGLNDVFKFYNGREANEENLIATLLDEAEVVKSTAADGSMTVTLVSTTGVPADGWEATVSQFLPGDMTFSGVAAQADETGTVAAGDNDARMLVVDVITDNQSNPLTLTGINLTTTSSDKIDAYRIYSLGKKNVFSTENVFASGAVGGSTIAATGSFELKEGHNWFAVVADVNSQVLNGDIIQFSVESVAIGAETKPLESAVAASRTVDNVCRATKGSHAHTIYDEWSFKNTESTVSPGKYEYDNADYIVTFNTGVENSVVQLDFSKFGVTYSSSTTYGTRAVFEVYSGNSVNSDNLLWQLNSADQATTGPGRTLRSTAADGSMTIRFNPNTTSSYYAATGWTAAVTPFINHNMSVDGVAVNQTSSDIISVGTKQAPLIDFSIATEGTLTTAQLSEVKLNLSGAEALEKVTVLYAGGENSLENAVEFGSATTLANGALAITGNAELVEGNNYFFVQVDVKDDADSEVAIDAALTELTTDGSAVAVQDGNPAGERVTKSMYLMQNGTNVVTVVKPIMFYDDGGPDSNFSKGFNGTVTFVPGVENCGIELNTKSFALGSQSYQKFYVYNGREAVSEQLVAQYSTTNGPVGVISKAADGSITVTFSTSSASYSSALAGFEIEVKLHEYEPLALDAITATPASTEQLVRGSSDAPMLKTALTVAHDTEQLSLNDFTFTTEGSTNAADIKAAKLYYTAKNTTFATTTLVGEVQNPSGQFTITAEQPLVIDDNGDYNLWLAYDIADDATAGNVVAANFVSLSGGSDTTEVNATAASRALKAGFKGTYTIGSSAEADYPTFAAAIAAMSDGVEGAVRFEVEDGTYAENVRISNIAGASEQHNITFIGKSGNRDAVKITGNGNPTTTDFNGSNHNDGMVLVENTPWVTLEGMSFIPSSQSYNSAVNIWKESRHFTLRNCYLKAELVTSGYSGMYIVKADAINEANRNNDYMTIEGNTIYGGYAGLNVGGTSYVALPYENGLVVRNNNISEARKFGIYVAGQVVAPVIEGNVISNSTTSATSYSPIDVVRMSGQGIIAGNSIVNTQSAYSNGIYLRETQNGADEPVLVYNNSVTITNSSSNSTSALYVNSNCKNVHFYYNTVSVAGGGGYAFYNAGNGSNWSGIKLQNNLLQTDGAAVMQFYNADKVNATAFVNNALWNTGGVIVKEYAASIDDVNAIEGSSANFVEQAEFLSATDLHLKSAGNLVAALPVDFITTDLEGTQRNAQTPTIGAFEFAEVIDEKPVVDEDMPVVGDPGETSVSITTKWNVSGKLYSMIKELDDSDFEAPAKGAPKRVPPTAEQLLAQTPVDYTAGTEAVTTFSDLTPATPYKAYFLLVSALGTQSDIVETEPFNTLRHIDPLVVVLPAVAGTINAGQSATLQTTSIAGGDTPYTYEWRNQMNEVIGSSETLTVSPEHSMGYKLTVTSADGQSVAARTGVVVRGEAVAATLDDNYLPEESFWKGDGTSNDATNYSYYSGSYRFNVVEHLGWSYWYGHALSNQTSSEFKGLNDQYHSSVGGGHNSDNFVVVYDPMGLTIDVTNDENGAVVPGVYVTNSAYTYSSLIEGDGYAEPIEDDGWFKVIATGTHADGTTSTCEFFLADYQSLNEADHYINNSWQWFDLRPLGKVTSVVFSFDGSDKNNYGLKTPAYMCLDDFGGQRETTEQSLSLATATATVDIADFFSPIPDVESEATVTYAMEDAETGAALAPARVPAEGTLSLALDGSSLSVSSDAQTASKEVIVSRTVKGKTEFVDLTVSVDTTTGIDTIGTAAAVRSIKYVNAAGQTSDRPFQGVNIKVTTMTDGTVKTVKMVK